MEYSPGENPSATPPAASDWLRSHPRFKPALKDEAAQQPKIIDYARGEVIHDHQRKLSGFALILKGHATLISHDTTGKQVEVGELGPGECFGDQLTTGVSSEESSIRAAEDVKLMLFDSPTISELLNRSPSLAAEIGDAIESRRQAARAARRRA
jgi:CRP-like cAMP-binding protein